MLFLFRESSTNKTVKKLKKNVSFDSTSSDGTVILPAGSLKLLLVACHLSVPLVRMWNVCAELNTFSRVSLWNSGPFISGQKV